MTQRDIEILHERLQSLCDDKKRTHEQLDRAEEKLDRIEDLAKATNGRVKELELWRAKWQGAEFTSRFIWLVAGGVIGAIALDILRSM